MNDQLIKVRIALTLQAAALLSHLDDAVKEIQTRGDRGDGPIPTVVIIVASVLGALLIAGGMAALYAKGNGKLGDIDLG